MGAASGARDHRSCGSICAATAHRRCRRRDQELTLDRLVADVAELLDHLGCGAAHVVGNSAGGYLGQQLAMTRPERVRSLCLFGSTPGLKNSQAPSWIPRIREKGMRGFLAETIRDRLPADTEPGARRMVSRRGGEKRPGVYRPVRAADGEL